MSNNPSPYITHFPDPPSVGLEPYVDDDDIIGDALARLERDVTHTTKTWGVPDREVYRQRLEQIRELIHRRSP